MDVCERVFAALLLLLALPAIAAGAVAIRILSGRAPFILHKRVGWRGSVLWILKLRTMWNPETPEPRQGSWVEWIEDESGPRRKTPEDARVPHGFARFCRRHSIDEFPQLWHVVRGDMALIGPRPVTRCELREYYGPAAAEVLRAKPGIAGLWQVSGRNHLTYEERVKMDVDFVRNRSLRMYGRILISAIAEIWTGAHAW